MKKIIGLIVTVFISGCAGTELKTDDSALPEITINQTDSSFYQHWVHSYEEQNGQSTANIFRPANSKAFAPSRFRMELAFDKSGQCNYMFFSPTGAHQMLDCVYTKIGKQVYLYDKRGASLAHLGFTIQTINSGEMRLVHDLEKPKLEDTNNNT